jgi:Cu-processing system permease protein
LTILTLAANTLRGLIRNRVVIVFFFVYLGLLLLALGPMLVLRNSATTVEAQEGAFVSFLSVMVFLTSSMGSFFAALGGAYAVSSEIQSGTILGVLARPVARWEFLVGSYLGVQGLLCCYVAFMLIFEEILSLIARQRLSSSWWVLAVYPLVRYMLYSAIAVFFATFVGPAVAVGATWVTSILASLLEGPSLILTRAPHWVLQPLRYLFPSIGLLAEERFLSVTSTALRPTPLADHLIALGHGLDYALIMLLLGAWIFRRRPLVHA